MANRRGVPIGERDYRDKARIANILLKDDESFKPYYSIFIEDIYESYDFSEFEELGYVESEIKDIISAKILSKFHSLFHLIKEDGRVVKIEHLDSEHLSPTYDGSNNSRFWQDNRTGKSYVRSNVLSYYLFHYLDFIINKYKSMESYGSRPDISEHLSKIQRDIKIKNLIDE